MSLPPLPRKPRLPTFTRRPPDPPLGEVRSGQADTDEFGLSREVFGELPPLARNYIARTYRSLGLAMDVAPVNHSFGTMPEAVFYGGLLARGYQPFGGGPYAFEFQSELLGGRKTPGGSVSDFLVYQGTRRLAVYVQSFFHALGGSFAGGAKIEQDRLLFERVEARTAVDAVLLVNEPQRGFPLERGPDVAILADFDRVLRS